MNKRAIIIIISVLILGSIVTLIFTKNPAKAPSVNSDSNATTSQNRQETESDIKAVATNTVEIKDFTFSPAAITVKKGTKVTWTNKDTTRHSVSPDTETAEFKSSQLFGQNETYSVTFNTTGTFTYHCTPHPYMKASVIVTD